LKNSEQVSCEVESEGDGGKRGSQGFFEEYTIDGVHFQRDNEDREHDIRASQMPLIGTATTAAAGAAASPASFRANSSADTERHMELFHILDEIFGFIRNLSKDCASFQDVLGCDYANNDNSDERKNHCGSILQFLANMPLAFFTDERFNSIQVIRQQLQLH
jgi:hypothetical protein